MNRRCGAGGMPWHALRFMPSLCFTQRQAEPLLPAIALNLVRFEYNYLESISMNQQLVCWCGNPQFTPFSSDYQRCTHCESLVWTGKGRSASEEPYRSGEVYYNRDYWFNHQTADLGLDDIETRARLDLPERCLYWLKFVLKYHLPPANVLELGSAHGGFVAMLRKAGYDAVGLEIDPWVVNFAQRTFNIPMLTGLVEEQQIEPASFDIIILMDVLEHLPDPQHTLEICTNLIKPDGLLVIQTPEVPTGKTYDGLIAEQHDFARMLIPQEHIHLFGKKGIAELCRRLGLQTLIFEPAFFLSQDQFFIASRVAASPQPPEIIEKHLLNSADGRIILALLDQDDRIKQLEGTLKAVEADHAERLRLIRQLEDILCKQDRIIRWLPHNILRRIVKLTKR